MAEIEQHKITFLSSNIAETEIQNQATQTGTESPQCSQCAIVLVSFSSIIFRSWNEASLSQMAAVAPGVRSKFQMGIRSVWSEKMAQAI